MLATWRLTHLLWAEDGPLDALAHLRRAAGGGALGRLLDCFYCTSLWVALPLAALLAGHWLQGLLGWLGLSGGACLLERATSGGAIVAEEPMKESP
jgi:hypothetical protein